MIVGVALLALGALFVVLGFRDPRARKVEHDEGLLAFFFPVQRGRYLYSSALPFTLGCFALLSDGPAHPQSFEFWAFWVGTAISILALLAIGRTGGDFVAVGEAVLTFQQMGKRHRVAWSDFERVDPKGPFQLFVHTRDRLQGGALYITTMHLNGDNEEIRRAIEDAAQAAADRRR